MTRRQISTSLNDSTRKREYSSDLWTIATEYNKRVEMKIIKFLTMIIIYGCVLLLINSTGYKEWNLFFFFATTILTIAILLSPISVTAAGLIGFVVHWLGDTDRSQGALRGVNYLLTRILPGVLIGLHILTGFMSTWSFENSPGSFFMILAGSMTIALVFYYYQLGGGKLFAWGIVTYTAVIMALALLKTFSADSQASVRALNPFYSTAEATCPVPTARNYESVLLEKGTPELLDVPTGKWSKQIAFRKEDMKRYGDFLHRFDTSYGLCVLIELHSEETVVDYHPPAHKRKGWEPIKVFPKNIALSAPSGSMKVETRWRGDKSQWNG